jgi:hypothetical protein
VILHADSRNLIRGQGHFLKVKLWVFVLDLKYLFGEQEIRVEGWALFTGLEPGIDGARAGPPNLTDLVELFFQWLLATNTGVVGRLDVDREQTFCLPLK